MNIEGYIWYGNNRKHIHKRAPKGSGGVGVFVRNELTDLFKIELLNDTMEGILWLSLISKSTTETLKVCVCYLPPANSSRQVNITDFLDTLL